MRSIVPEFSQCVYGENDLGERWSVSIRGCVQSRYKCIEGKLMFGQRQQWCLSDSFSPGYTEGSCSSVAGHAVGHTAPQPCTDVDVVTGLSSPSDFRLDSLGYHKTNLHEVQNSKLLYVPNHSS